MPKKESAKHFFARARGTGSGIKSDIVNEEVKKNFSQERRKTKLVP
jgi:hypothetical protein